MQNLKTKTIAIIIIALLTTSIGTMALANAHTPDGISQHTLMSALHQTQQGLVN